MLGYSHTDAAWSSLAWLVLGAAAARHLTDPRRSRAANASFAVLLLVSVALAVLG